MGKQLTSKRETRRTARISTGTAAFDYSLLIRVKRAVDENIQHVRYVWSRLYLTHMKVARTGWSPLRLVVRADYQVCRVYFPWSLIRPKVYLLAREQTGALNRATCNYL